MILCSLGTVTVLTLNVDYTVAGGSTDAGGTLTVTVAAAAGVRLLIERRTPRSQGTQYPTNDTFPAVSHESALDRAMAQMLDDPVARRNLPADMSELTLSAKRALVAMYIEASGRDVFGMHQLPEMVRWLQRAAAIHDESEAEVLRGHRDLAD